MIFPDWLEGEKIKDVLRKMRIFFIPGVQHSIIYTNTKYVAVAISATVVSKLKTASASLPEKYSNFSNIVFFYDDEFEEWGGDCKFVQFYECGEGCS